MHECHAHFCSQMISSIWGTICYFNTQSKAQLDAQVLYITLIVEKSLTFSCTKYKYFTKLLTFVDTNSTRLKVCTQYPYRLCSCVQYMVVALTKFKLSLMSWFVYYYWIGNLQSTHKACELKRFVIKNSLTGYLSSLQKGRVLEDYIEKD